MKQVVLVTGASGTLGRRISSSLATSGWRVRALVHRTPVDGVHETVMGSILDSDAMHAAVSGCSAVVHLAAVTHARRASTYRTVNIQGTRSVIAAAEGANIRRIVLISSRAVSPHGGSYAVSKLRAEEVVAQSRLDWTIVRLPELYGGGSAEGIELLIDRARRGRRLPIVGRGDDEVCPMHIDDAVAACVHALRLTVTIRKTYTLGGECMTLREAAELCQLVAGNHGRIVSVPRWLLRGAGELGRVLPLPVYPDQLARLRARKPPLSAEATTDLAFVPRSLETGLHDVM